MGTDTTYFLFVQRIIPILVSRPIENPKYKLSMSMGHWWDDSDKGTQRYSE